MAQKTILFLCKNNSIRSQICEAIVNHYYKKDFKAYSAGNKPTKIHPLTIQVLKEINIDISESESKHLKKFKNKKFDYIITVCDKGTCPYYSNTDKIINKPFPDIKNLNKNDKENLIEFRKLRNLIHKWIKTEIYDLNHLYT